MLLDRSGRPAHREYRAGERDSMDGRPSVFPLQGAFDVGRSQRARYTFGRRGTRRRLAFVLLLSLCGSQAEAQAARPAYACATSIAPEPAAARAEIRNSYAEWKRRYVTREGAGRDLRVKMPRYKNGATTSEAIGYGMLLAAYLDDRPTFDGLWRYTKRHLNPRGMMSWEVMPDGRVPDPNAATDGDQDIAFALVAADGRWGGYRADARALIGSILRHAVEPGTDVLKPGDVWGGSRVTNASYYAPAYYHVFAAYTGEPRWNRVADAAYGVLGRVVARHSPRTGLLPGWTTAAGNPAGGDFAFLYDYGSARIPWRLAMDAAWHCDRRARRHLELLNVFFQRTGVERLRDGYALDGRPTGTGPGGASFVAPAAAGAVVSADAPYRRAMWNETLRSRNSGYYGDSLRLLALLFASGEMPPPRVTRPAR
jgi:endo-1,4-beta-D-glucanase Y